MKNKIAFVIDSTTIMPEELMEKYRFYVVPLNINIKGETKHETDVTDEEIIAKLEDPQDMKSSSPAPEDFLVAYSKLFEEGYEDIIVITLSEEVSGTCNTAELAKASLDDEEKKSHIYITHTLACNYGVANAIMASLPLLEREDLTAKEVADQIQKNYKNTLIMFTILDLKHLFRGGRLSRLSCAIGLLFRIKPVIQMDEGKLKLAYKMRTKINIVDLFMKQIAEFSIKYKKVYLRFVNLSNPTVIEEMTEKIKNTFANIEVSSIDRVGPVFLVHLGNNGYGISLTGVDY